MLEKYLRQERLYKGEKPDLQLIIKRIKDRISIATPYSPIVVFMDDDGILYEFFARTVKSRTMIKDKSLNMVGLFHNEMHEAAINKMLTIH